MTDNMYPNTARAFTKDFVGMADLPYDFFMSRCGHARKKERVRERGGGGSRLPTAPRARDP